MVIGWTSQPLSQQYMNITTQESKTMNKQQFKDWVQDKVNLHPDKREDILEFFWLAMDEIFDGGSEQHEFNLAVNSINELIEI